MDGAGTLYRPDTAASRWARMLVVHQPGGAEQHPVDPAHRGAVARPAGVVPTVPDLPQRLIGDRAYDADPLDAVLAELGVEMIAQHWRGRRYPKTQDGRPLRRNRCRWKIERLFA